MARGNHPLALFRDPEAHRKMPMGAIYELLGGFSDEVYEDNTERLEEFSGFFILPPLWHEGKFVKGIFATHAGDLLLDRYPWIPKLFHVVAYAMWSAPPLCERAEVVMTTYDNPAREKWFKARYPHRAGQIWVPHDDTDLFNEMHQIPNPDLGKAIDVLVVSRLDQIKNLDMFALALKHIHRKTGQRVRALLHTGAKIDINWTDLHPSQTTELRKINNALGCTQDYLSITPGPIPATTVLYQQAKCVVMTALCEGKNRSIHEAMSCDVPVVVWKDFNQYSKGSAKAIPDGGGLLAPEFTAKSLGDTILKVLKAPKGTFNPREAVLKVSGRRTVFNALLRAVPHYTEQVPGWNTEQEPWENPWINAAVQALHGRSLHDYTYQVAEPTGRPRYWHKGQTSHAEALGFYEKFTGLV